MRDRLGEAGIVMGTALMLHFGFRLLVPEATRVVLSSVTLGAGAFFSLMILAGIRKGSVGPGGISAERLEHARHAAEQSANRAERMAKVLANIAVTTNARLGYWDSGLDPEELLEMRDTLVEAMEETDPDFVRDRIVRPLTFEALRRAGDDVMRRLRTVDTVQFNAVSRGLFHADQPLPAPMTLRKLLADFNPDEETIGQYAALYEREARNIDPSMKGQ